MTLPLESVEKIPYTSLSVLDSVWRAGHTLNENETTITTVGRVLICWLAVSHTASQITPFIIVRKRRNGTEKS